MEVPGLIAIDHVGIAVPDLDVAIAFYQDVFGFKLTHREVNQEQGVQEAMLSLGESETTIQLLAPMGPDSTIAKFLAKAGPGVQQLAFRVANIQTASAALRSAGLRLLYENAKIGTGGSLINFVHPKDAGGVLVELVQPPIA